MRWLTQQGLDTNRRLEVGQRGACGMGADYVGADHIPNCKVSLLLQGSHLCLQKPPPCP